MQHRPGHPAAGTGTTDEPVEVEPEVGKDEPQAKPDQDLVRQVYPAFAKLQQVLAAAFATQDQNSAASKADQVLEGALAALVHVQPDLAAKLDAGGKTFSSRMTQMAKAAKNQQPEATP